MIISEYPKNIPNDHFGHPKWIYDMGGVVGKRDQFVSNKHSGSDDQIYIHYTHEKKTFNEIVNLVPFPGTPLI